MLLLDLVRALPVVPYATAVPASAVDVSRRPVPGLVLAATVLALVAMPAAAAEAPVVAELFTSQSCSSCPPADMLLAELRRTRPGLLLLDFHVDYWNRLGWADPYASAAATERQRRHAAALGSDVYTPQLVVDGTRQVVGSDRAAVDAALADAPTRQAAQPPVALRLGRAGTMLEFGVGAGRGHGELVLVGFDDTHTTRVGGGENGGRTLTEVNVVRSVQELGTWDGAALQLQVPVPAGQRAALLLEDATGRILGAAVLTEAG